MNTDAKVYGMIDDLSLDALYELLGDEYGPDHSHNDLIDTARAKYESGDLPAEEIIAAWNDDTWNGVER